MSFLIRVPATSANLGPGFDCLGMALDLWNEIEVEVTGNRLEITVEGEGKSKIPVDSSNAIYQAMQRFAEHHHKILPAGIHLHCKNNIPLGAGLGSSAAAVVGGILAAAATLEIAQDKTEQLDFATQLEGHPDNVAPCLMGGLVATMVIDKQVIAKNLKFAPLFSFIIVPDFHFPTRASRAALPVNVPLQDAVFNVSRLPFLIIAMAEGNIDLLSKAMQDQIHQPYRIPLIPGAAAAISAAREAGAAAVTLSGAGPSLLVVVRKEADIKTVSQVMMDAFRQAGLNARVFSPEIAPAGASIINE